jgi:RES domain-containing protein
MQVWRICKQQHVATAFAGIGGLYADGRWTPQGYPVVYTAESLALASLEVFVHLESDRLPLRAIRANLSDALAMTTVEIADLPTDWQEITAYPVIQQIGREWLTKKLTPILKVPSAIIPVEFNYLLDPQHPDLRVELDPPLQFIFDRRLWKVNPTLS